MSNFVVEKDEINNVALTLSERSQLVDPWFLIIFTNKFSVEDVEKSCSVQNGVDLNIRYDLLIIEETEDPNPLIGQVFLIEGEWSYKVYESAIQTLDVDKTTERILQKGLLIVK